MDIKILIRILFLCLFIAFFYWLRVSKIPVLCLACEQPGTMTRCIAGTGYGTPTCTAFELQQQAVNGIGSAFNSVKNEISGITATYDSAVNKINNAKKTLIEALATITSLKIQPIPEFTIGIIQPINLNINFGAIPTIDICKNGIQPAIKGAAAPINTIIEKLQSSINGVIDNITGQTGNIQTAVDGLQSSINKITDDVNTAINGLNKLQLGIPQVNKPTLGRVNFTINRANLNQIDIDKLNLTCNLDIAKAIRDGIGSANIDIGKLLIDNINTYIIPTLNSSFATIGKGMSMAIGAINDGVAAAINGIITGINAAISVLQNQLESLNIFSGLTSKILELFSKVQGLNVIGLFNIYIMPAINAIIPGASIFDIITFILICFLSPYLFIAGKTINNAINMIPNFDVPIFPDWYSPYENAKNAVSTAIATASDAIATAQEHIENISTNLDSNLDTNKFTSFIK